jgi:DNA-binding MarR family transcriptional regulator
MKKDIVLSVKITPEQREKIKEMKEVHCLNVCAMVRNFIDEQYQKLTSLPKK